MSLASKKENIEVSLRCCKTTHIPSYWKEIMHNIIPLGGASEYQIYLHVSLFTCIM